MKRLLTTFFCQLLLFLSIQAQDQIPNVVSGKIERIVNFRSEYVTPRNIDVWLPEGYSEANQYSVLYMHDGQMLYDPEISWNKQVWNIDDVATELFRTDRVKKFIVVGIWNGGQTRHQDYFPQKPFEQMSNTEKDTVVVQLQRAGRTKEIFRPQSDSYLKFIVNELKPLIDKKYSVYTDREHTFIAGSSMGGLISVYAICEYPDVFCGAACLSTHWVGTFTKDNNPFPNAMIGYLSRNLPKAESHKIYFDCGDQTLDALYPTLQRKVDSVMVSKGYGYENWLTRFFPGEDHSEKSWSKRLNIPLEFLFNKH
jgi:enterochelin esterase-like enzyme